MKHLFMLVGSMVGSVVPMLFTSADWASWIGALVGCFLGHQTAGFLVYQKLTPKSFLAFHGPNSAITRTGSEGEMEVVLERLIAGGLVLELVAKISTAKVNRAQWETLSKEEQSACAQILSQACFLKGESRNIAILSEAGDVLAKWP